MYYFMFSGAGKTSLLATISLRIKGKLIVIKSILI